MTIPYVIVFCRNCSQDFVCRETEENEYGCPHCVDARYTEVKKVIFKQERFYFKGSWYSQEEDDYLTESRKRGIKYKQIAKELNRSESSVKRRMCILRNGFRR
jgi:hypothetical protein